jgi:heme/copper-type cytochrome/quinol oxidase subunit 2
MAIPETLREGLFRSAVLGNAAAQEGRRHEALRGAQPAVSGAVRTRTGRTVEIVLTLLPALLLALLLAITWRAVHSP